MFDSFLLYWFHFSLRDLLLHWFMLNSNFLIFFSRFVMCWFSLLIQFKYEFEKKCFERTHANRNFDDWRVKIFDDWRYAMWYSNDDLWKHSAGRHIIVDCVLRFKFVFFKDLFRCLTIAFSLFSMFTFQAMGGGLNFEFVFPNLSMASDAHWIQI